MCRNADLCTDTVLGEELGDAGAPGREVRKAQGGEEKAAGSIQQSRPPHLWSGRLKGRRKAPLLMFECNLHSYMGNDLDHIS